VVAERMGRRPGRNVAARMVLASFVIFVRRAVLVLAAALSLLPAASASAFPGRNGLIVTEGSLSARGLLDVRNADGTGARTLAGIGRPSRPAFSAAGVRLAFTAKSRIWVMQADGTSLRQLTTGYSAGDSDPAWSPAGAVMAYTSGPAGGRDIFAIGLDGNDQRRLTTNHADEFSPAWSARDVVAFVRRSDAGDGDIWSLRGSGGGSLRLTSGRFDDRDPTWSPDGRRIAFTRNAPGHRDIYVADDRGRKLRKLRTLPQPASSPVWSPDGRWIAFAMGKGARRGLWVMTKSGKRLRQIAKPSAGARSLDWQAVPGDPVVAAAGDVACDPASPSWNDTYGSAGCHERLTSDLMLEMDLAGVLMLGDAQYEDGAPEKFLQSYDPTWGRLKTLTHPVVGNHEYALEPAAVGYFDYFNGAGQSGGPAGNWGEGWYSFDVGAWHVAVLNSNCAIVSCAAGGPQEQWLRADLGAHPAQCTLGLMHHPLVSSGIGDEGATPEVRPLWQALYDGNADLVLSGHDHSYERFAPIDPNGVVDPVRGIREIISGLGGKGTQGAKSIRPGSEIRSAASMGVTRLALRPTGYDWQFVPDTPGGFTDAGSAGCH
jgi:hypothetical protein